jgi:NTP pyrophosphatase (non-canonical NTP hydrolase)
MDISDTNTNGFYIAQDTYARMIAAINLLSRQCHGASRANHWWDKERNIPECLCLIHSEISEAMEGYRKSKPDEHLDHHKSITVELADALIRILDLAGGLNLPIGEAFAEKFHYNQVRVDHKLEARQAPGGKTF